MAVLELDTVPNVQVLLVLATVVDYLLAALIHRSEKDWQKRAVLVFSLVLNLGLLGFSLNMLAVKVAATKSQQQNDQPGEQITHRLPCLGRRLELP